MLITHSNLTIRNAAASDAATLAAWWNDGAVMAHAGFPLGLGTTPEQVAESLSHDTDERSRRLIIEIDGVPSGEMSYRSLGVVPVNKTAEIGIKICDFSKQDKGLGKLLLSMFILHLFYEMGYQKIILDTNLDNKRAQHVYERLGFKKIRVRENAWKNQLGEPQSAVDYELFPEDFISFVT